MKNSNLFYSVLLCLFFLANSSQLIALSLKEDSTKKPFQARIYNTERITTKPNIDGLLNDSCWLTGNWSGDFIQWVPNEGGKPSQPTVVKVLYDDNSLYVAMRCYDSEPEKIMRKAGRRDELNGDMAGICIDSYFDHRTGFEFDMSAAGQKMDQILTNPSNGDSDWNAVWYGKVGMEDSAWVIEMEIPLSQLRFSNKDEQVWGFHAWRWIERYQEESDWEPQTSTGPGILYLFGELHGIKGLKKSQRIELVPYASGKLKTYKANAENPFLKKGRDVFSNIGLDAKIGIGSNFTVDLTLNPDFGQVEADPSNMNLSAFETFYDEKRPFFLEGKNIFNFGMNDMNLFYSRRVGHAPSYSPGLKDKEYYSKPENTNIISSVKFSGKTSKGLSIGVLQSLTAREVGKLHTEQGNKKLTAEPLINYLVARVQQDLNESNTIIGGILTSTNRFIHDSYLDNMNRDAYTGGVDLLHYWKEKKYYVEAKVIGSNIQGKEKAISELQKSPAHYYQRPDAKHFSYDSTLTQLTGVGGKIKIGKGSGLWRYSTEVSWKSPGLDLNDIGFMQTADAINQKSSISYFVNRPVSIFRTYRAGIDQNNRWDFNGMYQSSSLGGYVYAEFLNNWAINNYFSYNGRAIDTRILRGGDAMLLPSTLVEEIFVRSDYSKRVNVEFRYFTKIADNNVSRFSGFHPGLSVRPLSNLRLSLNANYTVNKESFQYVDTKDSDVGKKYILAQLNQETVSFTFRADYHITPELSVQYYGSPYATVGDYSKMKVITSPRASDLESRFAFINPVIDGNKFNIDDNNDGFIDYSFDNPNFTFNEIKSNLVFRWEYRPGSQLYLVWSHDRSDWNKPSYSSLREGPQNLWKTAPTNVFMVKFNYWFSI